mmetsp:Transcript_23925/g.54930  ORF Transcript_23925/g.54930 Transcript_23925/m.54930 type:complete len:127 (-) Transcript_23925:1127-1507(-)
MERSRNADPRPTVCSRFSCLQELAEMAAPTVFTLSKNRSKSPRGDPDISLSFNAGALHIDDFERFASRNKPSCCQHAFLRMFGIRALKRHGDSDISLIQLLSLILFSQHSIPFQAVTKRYTRRMTF